MMAKHTAIVGTLRVRDWEEPKFWERRPFGRRSVRWMQRVCGYEMARILAALYSSP